MNVRVPPRVLAGCVLLAVAALVLVLWLRRTPADPLYEKFANLRTGMTQEQVSQVLGGPGWEVKKLILSDFRGDNGEKVAKIMTWHGYWRGNASELWVLFGADDRVVAKRWAGS